ncbi:MAG: DedA family protein [Gammaproteobacteria bacterium]|nr:DedA family protein [Gammaproteobacteria bacterium]
MAENFALQFGYLGLFIISFLAATLLPFSSEAVVVLMPSLGYKASLVLIFATTGNFLGALTNYYAGKWGGDFLLARYIQVGPEKLRKVHTLYGRWGAPILFFSWVPLIGDPLTVIGGTLKVKLPVFIFWVLLGKTVRYLAVLGVGNLIFGSI